jgi:hypothetical protein
MSPPPERPCDDVGGLNSFLRETLGYAADFLDRPTDEVGCLGVALDLVFLGAGLSNRLDGILLQRPSRAYLSVDHGPGGWSRSRSSGS